MGESSDSVSIDIDMIPLGGKVRNSAYPTKKKELLLLFFVPLPFFLMQIMCEFEVVLFTRLFFWLM